MTSRATAAAAVALMVAAAASAAAEASFPGRNGRIAYSSLPSSAGEPRAIHTMSATGRRDRRLTQGGSARNPSWSADGRLIAYDATPASGEGPSRLYVMRAHGRRKRRVAVGRLDARNPSFAPDGRRLVFQGCRQGAGCDDDAVFVVRRRGGRVRRIAPAGADPVWSPDGRWIAYVGRVRADGCQTIIAVRPSGRGRRAVVADEPDENGFCPGASGIDFSPDSRRLVYLALRARRSGSFPDPLTGEQHPLYTYDHAMYTVGVDGRNRRLVHWRSIEDHGYLIAPFAWSPDGRRLLWRDDRGTFTSSPDGGGRRRIANETGAGGDYAWQARPR